MACINYGVLLTYINKCMNTLSMSLRQNITVITFNILIWYFNGKQKQGFAFILHKGSSSVRRPVIDQGPVIDQLVVVIGY